MKKTISKRTLTTNKMSAMETFQTSSALTPLNCESNTEINATRKIGPKT